MLMLKLGDGVYNGGCCLPMSVFNTTYSADCFFNGTFKLGDGVCDGGLYKNTTECSSDAYNNDNCLIMFSYLKCDILKKICLEMKFVHASILGEIPGTATHNVLIARLVILRKWR